MFIEISPADAMDRGIKDGGWVWVTGAENSAKVKVKALVTERVGKGVAWMPFHFGGWFVVLGGGAIAVSGYILIFPFYGTSIETMQSAEIAHGIIAMLFIAAMLGHIYIGTIGMEGAFEAMGTGSVDVNWAKEHHSLWLEEESAHGQRNPSQPQPTTAPGE